ncbi:DOPA 4,5-dioxygenase family protein [Caballeronia ptereochthonis]|uniref:Aromatic ring-cleaving dioxygenase-like protein n=1 Tax=Caballeronia ptereochthonis TaxID=1777144 RepID=A0A157ZR02_9BURK|nr:DOPA 4,5-dioxygenase family protein [Caballeronia ptereochthonis]SAK47899.1 aromatic ring-cleaving dioxygenase-like protein [Caballeronia ptereochthonis]
MDAKDTRTITDWHAHAYFDAENRDAAWQLRLVIEDRFADELQGGALRLGRFHERPVGPHPKWSFQLGFGGELLAPMLEWLTLNHGALDVFMHPNTGDALRDHRDSAVWIGRSHELSLKTLGG